MNKQKTDTPAEGEKKDVSTVYAGLMRILVRVGLAMTAFFALAWLGGFLPGQATPAMVAGNWSLPLADYLEVAAVRPGPLRFFVSGGTGGLLYSSIVFLAFIPLVCYLRIIPLLRNAGAKLSLSIAVLQALVLLTAVFLRR